MTEEQIKKNIKKFNDFMYRYADSHTPIVGEEEIRKFIKKFVDVLEPSYGINTQNTLHLKSSTWYPTQLLMKYIREIIRYKTPDIRMHKVNKKDEYWFERIEVIKRKGTIKLINDPRRKHPELRSSINRALRAIKETNPEWDIVVTFLNPLSCNVTVNPNGDDDDE